MTRHLACRQRAQALAEFAMVSTVLALVLGGVIEFGILYGHKVELANAARAGARWAASNPSAWSATPSPDSNTIEGQVRAAGGTGQLSNDDSHIAIEYYDLTGPLPVFCGRYSAAGAAFVPQPGFTQATCVKSGNLVKLTLTNSYPLLTSLLGGLLGSSVTLRGVSAMVLMS